MRSSTNALSAALTEHKHKTGGPQLLRPADHAPHGRGHKQLYRVIDFKRAKLDARAKVQAIEYDPNRSALIALIAYADGTKNYILAPNGLKVGATVISASKCENNEYRPGDAYPLETIPPSTRVHAVELNSRRGAQMARAAGRPVLSSSPWKMAMPSSSCPPGRFAWSTRNAARRSVRSATVTTSMSCSARPAGTAGSAAVRACAAWP